MVIIVRTPREARQWLKTVLLNPRLTAGDKNCAASLTTHVSDETGQCNPSNARLAKMTCQTERAIYQQVRNLRREGVLHWDAPRGRSSHRYRLVLDGTTWSDGPARDHFVPNDGSGQATVVQNRASGHGRSPAPLDQNGASGQAFYDQNGESGQLAPVVPSVQNGSVLPPALSGTLLPSNQEEKNHQEERNKIDTAVLEALASLGIVPDRGSSAIWDEARVEPPATIVFKSEQHLLFAKKHYSQDFADHGISAIARKVAA